MWLELPIIAMNSIKRCMNTFAAKSLYTMLKLWQHETGYLYVPLHWYEVEEWHKTWSHSEPKLKLHTRSSVWTKNLIITTWGESSKYLEWEQLLSMGSLLIERIFWSTSSDGTYRVAAGCATEAFHCHLCNTYRALWRLVVVQMSKKLVVFYTSTMSCTPCFRII